MRDIAYAIAYTIPYPRVTGGAREANTRWLNLGQSGSYILQRNERLGQAVKRLSERMADRNGPLFAWSDSGACYCKGPEGKPLGTKAFPAYLTRPLRRVCLPAPGGLIPANSLIFSNGPILSLSSIHVPFFCLGDW